MAGIRFVRKHDGALITTEASVADTFVTRLRGLIGRSEFRAGEGLLFPRCSSVHMWMMRIPIDVLFLRKRDAAWEVLSVHAGLRPWKVLPVGNLRADDVLELPAGTVARHSIREGEVLCIAS
jgi:uncharacterized membrane protein (UPF0127 family)